MGEQTPQQRSAFLLMLDRLDLEGRITVMDVGKGVSGSVGFFNTFPCRLYFLDLFDRLSQDPYAPLNEIKAGVPFDTCLLWDYWNFLDDEQLTLFLQALHPFIHEETLIHLIAAHSRLVPVQKVRYSVDESGSIIWTSDDSVPVPYPRTRAELVFRWPQFIIERGTLLGDNRMELVAREG